MKILKIEVAGSKDLNYKIYNNGVLVEDIFYPISNKGSVFKINFPHVLNVYPANSDVVVEILDYIDGKTTTEEIKEDFKVPSGVTTAEELFFNTENNEFIKLKKDIEGIHETLDSLLIDNFDM